MSQDDRIPTDIWVKAGLRRAQAEGMFTHVIQSGAYATGTVIVKIVARPSDEVKLLTQIRNIEGDLEWGDVFEDPLIEESRADKYIRDTCARDPDVWVIEVEDREGRNPFWNR